MAHLIHDYIVAQLEEKLRKRGVVVWYDPLAEFVGFFNELVGEKVTDSSIHSVSLADQQFHLLRFTGSFLELRILAEPLVSGQTPENVVLYIPKVKRDQQGSFLMELEQGGECYQPKLVRVARNALRQRFTDGIIDDILNRQSITYEYLTQIVGSFSEPELPSVLRAIFPDSLNDDGILLAWVALSSHDEDIVRMDAIGELIKLVHSRLGLTLSSGDSLAKMRSITVRYVLGAEFYNSLNVDYPGDVRRASIPNQDILVRVKRLCEQLRLNYPAEYMDLADRAAAELGLHGDNVKVESLTTSNTFRFQERSLLQFCSKLIVQRKFDTVLDIVETHNKSFWVEREPNKKVYWEMHRRMAELGSLALRVKNDLSQRNRSIDSWVDAYSNSNGWYQMDQAQRHLEFLVHSVGDEMEVENPLAIVRGLYEEVCHTMATEFGNILNTSNWTGFSGMHQTQIYSRIVEGRSSPVAYVLVDALRFEMGADLKERLSEIAEVNLRCALGSLPGITCVGMAALMPGASGDFTVMDSKGKLGARVDQSFLPDLTARKRFVAARIPGQVDLALDELLQLPLTRLTRKIACASMVIVRSQELDLAGETGSTLHSRNVMDNVLDNLYRAIRKLARAGIRDCVLTSDHGHLFFASERDQSMRIDSPKGVGVELHRRCWIGRGGATPSGSVRVTASSLGYDSDLDFVFPSGSAVFRAGGDLMYYHGGVSLQEMVIPVLTVKYSEPGQVEGTIAEITSSRLPAIITTRIFSIELLLWGLLPETVRVRPILVSEGKQVGVAGLARDAEFDESTGCVTLESGKPTTVGIILKDDSVKSVRLVLLDPLTDADLSRATVDIPVRLGV